MDCSPTGFPVHGILQARIVEWVAMPSPPGDLPNPGIEPVSLESLALASRFFATSTTWEAHSSNGLFFLIYVQYIVPGAVETGRGDTALLWGSL